MAAWSACPGGAIDSPTGCGGSGIVVIRYPGQQRAIGGNVTCIGGNTIHTFTSSSNICFVNGFVCASFNYPLSVNYLVVAGGGGGGSTIGGGGGGGGVRTNAGPSGGGSSSEPQISISATSYQVIVGAGGTSQTQGSNSCFMANAAGIISIGGGNGNGQCGGSGGAQQAGYAGVCSGTPGQGYSSGNPGSSNSAAAGGGGAGGLGQDVYGACICAGNGGVGLFSVISGANLTYAGGGGGGARSIEGAVGIPGLGGNGGGAPGSAVNISGASPTNNGNVNTGGGGGGTGYNSYPFGLGGCGGSGIVIISYPGTVAAATGGTITCQSGNVIHTFTSSGNLCFLQGIII